MKKSILKLKGVRKLTSTEQKAILGGNRENPYDCCWREDSPPDSPYGCESYILC
jgi:hypothetical protein